MIKRLKSIITVLNIRIEGRKLCLKRLVRALFA